MKHLLAFFLCMLMTGCTSDHVSSHAGQSAEKAELYVLAAASLTETMDELETVYEAENPYVDVILNCASSGSLQRQIEQGAPADVFVSASLSKMKTLDEEGLLANGCKNLLRNEIVLAVSKGSTDLDRFEDLLKEDLVLAMGEPESVPAGRYAKEVLVSLALDQAVIPRMIIGKNVTELITWLEAGEVDGALVYATDAEGSKDVVIAARAPEGSHSPIIYPCAQLAEADQAEEAGKFIEFLMGDAAGEVFEAYGFDLYDR